MIEMSKSDTRVHLHNLVQDEIVPECWIFFAGRQILEVDIDHIEAHPARRTPRDPLVKARHSPRVLKSVSNVLRFVLINYELISSWRAAMRLFGSC
jgi:hypothetical protein